MIFEITLKSPRVYRSYHEICNGLCAHIKVDFNTGCDIIQVGHFIPVHVILLIFCLTYIPAHNTGYEPISVGTKQPQIEYRADGMMRNCSLVTQTLNIAHECWPKYN